MSQPEEALQPRRIGRFTLVERLGVGGRSEVWRVSDETADANLALKILTSAAARSSKAWAELEREYAVSALLRHRGILRVLPPERLHGCVVLPMELADGGNLTKLRGKGYLEIVPVLLELTDALGYAHARGVVHRDLKPGNVLLDGSGRVKLADFGVASVLPGSGAEQTVSRSWGGSPFTASPGQLRGEPPSPADDVYGLGALAYELLSGRPPYYPKFDAEQIQEGPVPQLVPARQAPVQLLELVMRMLANRVEDRPSSMHAVSEELEMCLNATLALDLTELADLSEGALPRAQPEPEAKPQPTRLGAVGGGLRVSAANRPVKSPPAVSPGPVTAPEPEPEAEPEPELEPRLQPAPRNSLPPSPVLGEGINPYLDEVPSLRATPLARRGNHYGRGSVRRSRSHRLRYTVLGVMFGVGGALVVFQGPPSGLLGPHMLHSVETFVAQIRNGATADRAQVASADEPAPTAKSGEQAGRAVASVEWAARAKRDSRLLHRLVARGAALWDPAGVAAAKQQVEKAHDALKAHDTGGARRHWQRAERLLAGVQHKVRHALLAELAAGQKALAAGDAQAAHRAFSLASRIDTGRPQAAAARPHAHPLVGQSLEGVDPLLSKGRRAERAGNYSRAMYYFKQAVVRQPHYAPARTALAQVRRNYRVVHYHAAVRAGRRAIAEGRLYHAQADFLQALVFRPEGIEAATELGKVNAILHRRHTLAQRVSLQRLGSD